MGETEKAESLRDLQAQLYDARQQLSVTENKLRQTQQQLQDAIDDGNRREADANERLQLSDRTSQRMLAREDRDLEAVNALRQESKADADDARSDAEKLRKDLRALLAHNAKVEKDSAELIGTAQELQQSLRNQGDL